MPYQPVVKHGIVKSAAVGWHPEGRAFATLKGANTARRQLAEKFYQCSTGVLAPSGLIVMVCPALAPDWEPPHVVQARMPTKIKKRRLTPRA